MNRLSLPMLIAAAVLGFSLTAQTAPLYRWVDEEGGVHFSDQPPAAGTRRTQSQSLRRPDYAEPIRAPEQDPYSILNQAKRLEAQRRQREDERRKRKKQQREFQLEKRRLEVERERANQPLRSAPVLVYPRHHRRPPIMPYHRPGPPSLFDKDHPAFRPGPPRPNRSRPRGSWASG